MYYGRTVIVGHGYSRIAAAGERSVWLEEYDVIRATSQPGKGSIDEAKGLSDEEGTAGLAGRRQASAPQDRRTIGGRMEEEAVVMRWRLARG